MPGFAPVEELFKSRHFDQDFSHLSFLDRLLDAEASARRERAVTASMRAGER